MPKVKVQVTFDEELLKRIDDTADELYINRSALVSLATSQFITQQELSALIKDMALAMRKIADSGSVSSEVMEQLEDFERFAKLFVPLKQFEGDCLESKKKYSTRDYEKNREIRIQNQKERYANNRDELLAYQKRRYYENSFDLIQYQKERYERNKEALQAYQREYYRRKKLEKLKQLKID